MTDQQDTSSVADADYEPKTKTVDVNERLEALRTDNNSGHLSVVDSSDGKEQSPGTIFPRRDEWMMAEHVADAVLERVVFTENKWHTYDTNCGIWRPQDDQTVRRSIGECLRRSYIRKGEDSVKPISVSASLISGVVNCMKSQAARPNFFAAERPGIAFDNGFLTFDGGRVVQRDSSPENRCRFALPLEYDDTAECPQFLRALRRAFANRDDAEGVIDTIAEFAGAMLFGVAPKYQRAIIFVGKPNAGKSTICDVLKALMPQWTISAIPPQRMGKRFGLASLPGKRANIVNETPQGRVLNGERFKAVVVGDAVEIEQKNRDSFSHEPSAAHLFAANPPLPEVPGADPAFWRRWMVVEFDRVIPESERDPDFARKIVDSEAAGVVNWAVEGIERLTRREGYELPDSCADALEKWRGDADSVARWARERLETVDRAVDGDKITDLHQAYRDWHQACGGQPVARREFKARLRHAGYYVIGKGPAGSDRWNAVEGAR